MQNCCHQQGMKLCVNCTLKRPREPEWLEDCFMRRTKMRHLALKFGCFLGILTSLLIEDHSISRSRVASQSCMVFCLTPFFRPVAWQSGSEGMLYFTGTLPRKAATEKTLTSNTGYLPAKFLKALMDSGSATSAVCRCRWEAGMVGCSETWFWSKVESCGRRVYIYICNVWLV